MMHLISFLINSPMNHIVGSWRHDEDGRLRGFGSIGYWTELGRILEKGKFDAVFFADIPATYDTYKDSIEDVVRSAVCWPAHDPFPVLSIMAGATENLGLVLTKSISSAAPYEVVRSLSTLDHLSGGRAGWNVVTGHLRAEHRAVGLPQMGHDERYDRADEYMEVCRRLWTGIPDDAIIMDKSTGVFADPSMISRVEFKGRYITISAIPPVLPSAQKHPVVFQAGSSGRGRAFALKNAEVIFAIQSTEAGMRTFVADMNAHAEQVGMPGPKVTFGIQVILGGTEAEARRHQEELAETVSLGGALSRLSGTMGIDFSRYDLDQPIVMQQTQGSQGGLAMLAAGRDGRQITLREAALASGASSNMLQVVGSPEQVANTLERLWQESGCFGFNISPTYSNSSISDFVENVVPLLQKRGVFRRDYRYSTLRENLLDQG